MTGASPFVAILRRVFSLAYGTLLVAASVMAVSSYFAYTTIGFDFETDNGQGVDARYDRLRWDDGCTWIGMAVQPCGRPKRPLDWFDPGGSILERPRRPVHPHWWNDFGFWRVTSPADDPYVPTSYIGAKASSWWACPSWLVLLVLWARPLCQLMRRRFKGMRTDSGPPGGPSGGRMG